MPGNGSTARGNKRPKPDAALQAGVERYGVLHGLPAARIGTASVVACPTLGRQIAAAYEAAPRLDERARPAYAAFRDETWRQLDYLTRPTGKDGLGFTVLITGDDPYQNIDELLADLAVRRLRIWATTACGNPHPLLSEHDNDAFRAVHDAFGHGATGGGFDADGEEAAWWAHRRLYSPQAARALLTETRGQTNALFYGPQAGFAVQKAALLDERFGARSTLHRRPCGGRCVA